MRVVEINAANRFSTGNIMLGIADCARNNKIEVYTASKYSKQDAEIERKRNNPWHFLIGNRLENTMARYFAWYTDFQDVGPFFSTKALIKKIKEIQPDVIHLHDIVGWYVDIDLFFSFLKQYSRPIIWTMHCCWAYTARCIYYDSVSCDQWKIGCNHCPQLNTYPYSKVFDRSKWNYSRKKRLFTSVENLTIVTPSSWLADEIRLSYLAHNKICVINNGIDISIFSRRKSDFIEKYGLTNQKIVLFVASAWSKRKGLMDAFKVAESLSPEYKVVIVGLSQEQLKQAPTSVVGLGLTKDAYELAEIYSSADVLVNPTYEDNYPTVNLETQACGTPVITYQTGGSPESVNREFGAVVQKGNIEELIFGIVKICSSNYTEIDRKVLETWARSRFSKNECFQQYVDLYKEVVQVIL